MCAVYQPGVPVPETPSNGSSTTPSPQSEAIRQWHLAAAASSKQAGLPQLAEKLAICHDGEHIVAYRGCREHSDHHRKPIHYSCRLSICPTCSHSRVVKMVRRYGETAFNLAKSGGKRRGLSHLVLTTPYSLDDPDLIEHYEASWTAATKTVEAALCTTLKDELSEKERKKGILRWKDHRVGLVIGADWGKEGNKLHFHSLFYAPYIEYDVLREKWADYTDGAAQDVRIKKINVSQEDVDRVIAYIGKLSAVPPDLVPKLYRLLERRRRIRSRGVFQAIGLSPRRASHTCPDCGAPLITTAVPG